MPLTFYKANSAVKGALCSFSFNSKGQALYVELVKQVSYNAEKRLGSFSGGKKCVAKFSVTEIGDFILALEKNKEVKPFHSFNGETSQITFGPLMSKPKTDDEKPTQIGFKLNIYKSNDGQKENFSIGFSFAESVVLREYFKFVLQHIYSAIYSADKQSAEQRGEKKGKKQDKPKEEAPQDNDDPPIDGGEVSGGGSPPESGDDVDF